MMLTHTFKSIHNGSSGAAQEVLRQKVISRGEPGSWNYSPEGQGPAYSVCVKHQSCDKHLSLLFTKQAQIWGLTPLIQVNIFQTLEQTAQDALESSSLEMLKNTHGCRAKGEDLLIYWLAMLG